MSPYDYRDEGGSSAGGDGGADMGYCSNIDIEKDVPDVRSDPLVLYRLDGRVVATDGVGVDGALRSIFEMTSSAV